MLLPDPEVFVVARMDAESGVGTANGARCRAERAISLADQPCKTIPGHGRTARGDLNAHRAQVGREKARPEKIRIMW